MFLTAKDGSYKHGKGDNQNKSCSGESELEISVQTHE